VKASELPRRAPSVTARVSAHEFADSWGGKPKGEVTFGLRLLSDAEEGQARREAAEHAAMLYQDVDSSADMVSEYNDALMSAVVGASICDPSDIDRWPPSLPVPQESIRDALLPGSIRRLFDAYISASTQTCPSQPEASNDEIDELLAALDDLEGVDNVRASRVRRLLKAAHEVATEEA
jgi:hypothetical protein